MGVDKNNKTKIIHKEKNSFADSDVTGTNLKNEQRDKNDYYDFYTCYTQMPDKKCHIRSEDDRCMNLRIEYVGGTTEPEIYRYFCIRGCFDYLSNTKLH